MSLYSNARSHGSRHSLLEPAFGRSRLQISHSVGVILCTTVVTATALWRFLPISTAFLFGVMALALIAAAVIGTSNRGNQFVLTATLTLVLYTSLISLTAPPENLFLVVIPLGLYATFLGFNSMAPTAESLRGFIVQMSLVARVVILLGLLQSLTSDDYLYYKTNVQFLLLFFLLANARVRVLTKIVFSGFWVYQAYTSSDRAPIFALGAVFLVWALWKLLTRRRALGAVALTVFLAAIGTIPPLYANYYFTANHLNIGDPMSGYSGSLLSAREHIWGMMLRIAAERSLAFGGGLGLQPTDYGSEFSFHSTIISLLARTGVVGLVLFLLLIFAVMAKYSRFPENPTVRMSAAYTIGLLVMHISEIGFNEEPAQAIITWLIVAFGSISVNALARSAGDGPAVSSLWEGFSRKRAIAVSAS